VFEDIFIENAAIREFPGMRRSLDQALVRLVEDGSFGCPPEDAPPAAQLQSYTLLRARERGRDQPILTPTRESMESRMDALFPPTAMLRLKALIDQSSTLRSTHEALALAKRVRTMLDEEAAKEPPPPPPEPEPNDEPTEGQGDGAGDAGMPGPTDDTSTPGGGQASDEPGDGDASGRPSASTSPSPPTPGTAQQQQALKDAMADDRPDNMSQDLADVLGKALQDEGQALASAGKAAPSQAGSEDHSLCEPELDAKPLDLQAVGLAAAQTRTALFVELESAVQRETRHRDEGDALDTDRLHEALCPHPAVFAHESDQLALNCAVQVLVDVSGSMSGERVQVAREAAYATSQALNALDGVVVSVAAFPGHAVILDFEEAPGTKSQQFQLATFGGTPLGAAVERATTRLLERRETRKVLVVLTDGEPDSRTEAIRAIGMATALDIECIGIGIQSNAVVTLFQKNAVIASMSELPAALWSALRTTLLDALEAA